MDPPPTEYVFRGRIINYSIEKNLYDNMRMFRKWRDYALVGIVAVYLLNIIDAMIDAHFLEYDVSDDLSLKISPSLINRDIYETKIGMSLCVKF